jgi:hypothetical protein
MLLLDLLAAALVQPRQHPHQRDRLHRDRELLRRVVLAPAEVVKQPHAVLVPPSQGERRAPLVGVRGDVDVPDPGQLGEDLAAQEATRRRLERHGT